MHVKRDFFARDTRVVAKDLIGREITRNLGRKKITGIITETEAYHGFSDNASHASRGITKRNAPMFCKPGTIYVYMVYGIHYCFNISTVRAGFPGAVLIRGIFTPGRNICVNGPGRVAKYMQISKSLDGKDAITGGAIAVGGKKIVDPIIKKAVRVGVEYAGEYSKKQWRYLLQL